jgi:hypothetical protein
VAYPANLILVRAVRLHAYNERPHVEEVDE